MQPTITGIPVIAALRQRAAATLLRNWRGSFTVPTTALYPHQWSWDSAFIAIGLAHLDPGRALTELTTLHNAQWRDGRVPQIVFNPAVHEDVYFPGPRFWRPLPEDGPPQGVKTTGLVQPPVHALALQTIAKHAPEAARQLYPRLARFHDYLFTRRRLPSGLIGIVHPWESGLDNSPAWDEPISAVPTDNAQAIETLRRDLRHADPRHRPTNEDYARYVSIAAAYRDRGYTDNDLAELPFCVADPLFNTLLACSEQALADLAPDPGQHRERAAELTHQIHTHLFDQDLGCYVALDARTGRRTTQRTISGLIPLLLRDQQHRDPLLATLTGPAFRLDSRGVLGVPSYDLTATDLDRHLYWRGPTWLNTNWLLWQALLRHGEQKRATKLATGMIDLIAGAGFREYFDPLTGEGLGSDDFSWSAALLLDVLAAGGEQWAR